MTSRTTHTIRKGLWLGVVYIYSHAYIRRLLSYTQASQYFGLKRDMKIIFRCTYNAREPGQGYQNKKYRSKWHRWRRPACQTMTSKFCTRSPIRHHSSIKFCYWPRENRRFTFERCNERGVFHLFYVDTRISRVICVAISLQPITICTIFLVDSNDHFSKVSRYCSILSDTPLVTRRE